jgi:hypothetical protein
MDSSTNPDHSDPASERLGDLIADMNGIAGRLDGPDHLAAGTISRAGPGHESSAPEPRGGRK